MQCDVLGCLQACLSNSSQMSMDNVSWKYHHDTNHIAIKISNMTTIHDNPNTL